MTDAITITAIGAGAAVLLAVVATVLIRRHRAAIARRGEAIARQAPRLGLTYSSRVDVDPQELVAAYYREKLQRCAMDHVLKGKRGDVMVTVADLTWVYRSRPVEGGQRDTRVNRTVALFECPRLHLPPFHLVAMLGGLSSAAFTERMLMEPGGARLARGLVIAFDQHPAFAAQYLVYGEDETDVRSALTPRVLDFFAANPGWIIDAAADQILVYRDVVTHPRQEWRWSLNLDLVPGEMFGAFLDATLEVMTVTTGRPA